MSAWCWKCIWKVSWKLSERVWKKVGRSLKNLWKVLRMCFEVVWSGFERYLIGVWNVLIKRRIWKRAWVWPWACFTNVSNWFKNKNYLIAWEWLYFCQFSINLVQTLHASRHYENLTIILFSFKMVGIGSKLLYLAMNVYKGGLTYVVLETALCSNGGWNLIIKRRLAYRKYVTARRFPERRPVFSLEPRL